jgi:hypothetical protein
LAQSLAAIDTYTEALTKASVLKGANRLKPSWSATTVRNADGKTQVLDGTLCRFEGAPPATNQNRRRRVDYHDLRPSWAEREKHYGTDWNFIETCADTRLSSANTRWRGNHPVGAKTSTVSLRVNRLRWRKPASNRALHPSRQPQMRRPGLLQTLSVPRWERISPRGPQAPKASRGRRHSVALPFR